MERYLDSIVSYLKENPVVLSNNSDDGRVNSIENENELLDHLDKSPFGAIIERPQIRAWYDFSIQVNQKSIYILLGGDFLDVKTITSGDKPWSTRIWNALKCINTEYVLFFLEDQFLQKPVNVDWLNKAFEYMKRHTDTGVIILRHTGKQKDDYPEVFFHAKE